MLNPRSTMCGWWFQPKRKSSIRGMTCVQSFFETKQIPSSIHGKIWLNTQTPKIGKNDSKLSGGMMMTNHVSTILFHPLPSSSILFYLFHPLPSLSLSSLSKLQFWKYTAIIRYILWNLHVLTRAQSNIIPLLSNIKLLNTPQKPRFSRGWHRKLGGNRMGMFNMNVEWDIPIVHPIHHLYLHSNYPKFSHHPSIHRTSSPTMSGRCAAVCPIFTKKTPIFCRPRRSASPRAVTGVWRTSDVVSVGAGASSSWGGGKRIFIICLYSNMHIYMWTYIYIYMYICIHSFVMYTIHTYKIYAHHTYTLCLCAQIR